jgi:hypothetical protein
MVGFARLKTMSLGLIVYARCAPHTPDFVCEIEWPRPTFAEGQIGGMGAE